MEPVSTSREDAALSRISRELGSSDDVEATRRALLQELDPQADYSPELEAFEAALRREHTRLVETAQAYTGRIGTLGETPFPAEFAALRAALPKEGAP